MSKWVGNHLFRARPFSAITMQMTLLRERPLAAPSHSFSGGQDESVSFNRQEKKRSVLGGRERQMIKLNSSLKKWPFEYIQEEKGVHIHKREPS